MYALGSIKCQAAQKLMQITKHNAGKNCVMDLHNSGVFVTKYVRI